MRYMGGKNFDMTYSLPKQVDQHEEKKNKHFNFNTKSWSVIMQSDSARTNKPCSSWYQLTLVFPPPHCQSLGGTLAAVGA